MIMTKRAAENCLSNRALAFSIDALLAEDRPKIQKTGGEEEDSATSQNSPDGDTCSPSPESPFQDFGGEENRIQVELQGNDLWTRFHKIGNEMIITKSGRRIFPALKVRVSGLVPEHYYIMWVDLVPIGHLRYRYVYHSSQWVVAGAGDEVHAGPSMYVHPDSPSVGRHWQSQIITFDKLKLTNSKNSVTKGQIALNSMHKYQPRIHVQKTCFPNSDPWKQADEKKALTFTFPETEFVTVTAYQNQQITRLKIASNPFAKGFREVLKGRKGTEEGSKRDTGNVEDVKNRVTYPPLEEILYAAGTSYQIHDVNDRREGRTCPPLPRPLYQPYMGGFNNYPFPMTSSSVRTVSSCIPAPSCYDLTYLSSPSGPLNRSAATVCKAMDMELHPFASKNKHFLNLMTPNPRWKSNREEGKPTARVTPILLHNNTPLCLQDIPTAWFALEGKES